MKIAIYAVIAACIASGSQAVRHVNRARIPFRATSFDVVDTVNADDKKVSSVAICFNFGAPDPGARMEVHMVGQSESGAGMRRWPRTIEVKCKATVSFVPSETGSLSPYFASEHSFYKYLRLKESLADRPTWLKAGCRLVTFATVDVAYEFSGDSYLLQLVTLDRPWLPVLTETRVAIQRVPTKAIRVIPPVSAETSASEITEAPVATLQTSIDNLHLNGETLSDAAQEVEVAKMISLESSLNLKSKLAAEVEKDSSVADTATGDEMVDLGSVPSPASEPVTEQEHVDVQLGWDSYARGIQLKFLGLTNSDILSKAQREAVINQLYMPIGEFDKTLIDEIAEVLTGTAIVLDEEQVNKLRAIAAKLVQDDGSQQEQSNGGNPYFRRADGKSPSASTAYERLHPRHQVHIDKLMQGSILSRAEKLQLDKALMTAEYPIKKEKMDALTRALDSWGYRGYMTDEEKLKLKDAVDL